MIQEYQWNEGRSCIDQCCKSNKAKEHDQLLKIKLLESYCISPCRRRISCPMYRAIMYRNPGPKLREGESAQESLFQCHSVISTCQGTNVNENCISSCPGEHKGTLVSAERDRDVAPDPTNTENSLTLRKIQVEISRKLPWASLSLAQQVNILVVVQTGEIREIPFLNALFSGTQHLTQY